MNERIQNLYDKADKFANENRTQIISGPGNNYFELFHEKFAELIVRECLEACSRANEIRHFVPPGQQQVVLDCMREIETTFRS